MSNPKQKTAFKEALRRLITGGPTRMVANTQNLLMAKGNKNPGNFRTKLEDLQNFRRAQEIQAITEAIEKGFDTYGGAPARKYARVFAKEAVKYPATRKQPFLVPALSILETSGGKNVTYPNNITNWGIYEPTFKPKDVETVIERTTSGLAKRYPQYKEFQKTGKLKDLVYVYAPPTENNSSQYLRNLKEKIKMFNKHYNGFYTPYYGK